MAGDTSRIDIATLKLQWSSHSSYAAICSYWTITKDQLVRLRDVLPLPLRTDRKLRYRPPRSMEHPSPAELRASEESLSLAPMIAARATCVTIHWTEEVRASRRVSKPEVLRLDVVETSPDIRDMCDDLNREVQW